MLTKAQAIEIAEKHTAQVPFVHADYRLGFELAGRIGEQWLFAFRVECLRAFPLDEQEQFAGAAGFIVSPAGQVRDLTVPMYMEAEQMLTGQEG